MPAAEDGAAEPPTLSITLACNSDALDRAQQAVGAYLERRGIASRVRNRIEVVIEELVGNVLRHGSGASEIGIRACDRADEFDLAIEDDGAAFDPLEVAAPAPFADLPSAAIGGLGIPLVRKLSASVAYQRSDSGRNRVTVRFAKI